MSQSCHLHNFILTNNPKIILNPIISIWIEMTISVRSDGYTHLQNAVK